MTEPLSALDYHAGTQHPDGALMDPRHAYLPGMRPVLFKHYRGLPAVELPVKKPADRPAALSAIGGTSQQADRPDLTALARLLHYSAGITKRLRGYRFRAAACTGALYHIELYLVCESLSGLEAGVYHYDPEGSRLVRLRSGDHRGHLAQAAGENQSIRQAPASVVYTDVYWRNAVKYQARAYRHAFWDAGVILANTLSLAKSLELPARLVMGFADDLVARLLAIDPTEELPLALLPLGGGAASVAEAGGELEPIDPEWEPHTSGSRAFPVIPRIHRQTSLASPEAVRAWRDRAAEAAEPEQRSGEQPERRGGETSRPGGSRESVPSDGGAPERGGGKQSGQGARQAPELELRPPSGSNLPDDSLERVIRRRGSSRAFAREAIRLEQLATLLDRSIRPIRADCPPSNGLIQPYLIANAVEGLEPGVYRVQPGGEKRPLGLRKVRAGQFRLQAAQLALGQALGGDAAVNLYFLADLAQAIRLYGERGYRLAQLEAAIMAGWGYLAAYALGIGATGLTFFDEIVEAFLGVSEQQLKPMFLLAVGVPGYS